MAARDKKNRRRNKNLEARRKKEELKRLLLVELFMMILTPFLWGSTYLFGQLDLPLKDVLIWGAAGIAFQVIYIVYTSYTYKHKRTVGRFHTVIFVNYWLSSAGILTALGCEVKSEFLGTLICLVSPMLFMIAAVGNWVDILFYFLICIFTFVRMNLAHDLSLEVNTYLALIVGLCIVAFWYRNRAGEQLVKDADEIKQVTNMAETDPMTKLLNRRGMENRMMHIWPQCLREEKEVAVIMMDIDFFKSYNDTFGHLQGDECIKAVAKQIATHVRRETDFAARVGGEEFLVFLYGAGPKQALTWAKDLKDGIEDLMLPHTGKNFLPFVTVSMGIYSERVHRGLDFFELQDNADRALYEAKDGGRACISLNGNIYAKTEAKPGAGSQDYYNVEFRNL